MQFSFKKFLPHLYAVIAFVVLAGIYASPALQGKKLKQHDITMSLASSHESTEFTKATGIVPWWTNSMFGGMPAYMIHGAYPNSIGSTIGGDVMGFLPLPINVIFLEMLGMYILLIVLGANTWQSIIGAIGYAFCTLNMVILPAGHTSKAIALAYAPMIAAGAVLCFRGKYLLGGALTALFMSLEIYANHVQITYYFALLLFGYVIVEIINHVKQGKIKSLVFALLALGLGSFVGVANHTMRLWNNYEYSKETIRGKSELTSNTESKGGLDRDYAFSYSYGIGETGTLLIPNFYGGTMGGTLGGKKSETLKAMVNAGIPEENALPFTERGPAYWGDQPNVGGPVYAGAIICFLFALGAFLVRGSLKWWLVGTAVFFTMLAWGKNFPLLNYPMFDYFPMFNKFRAITMILSLTQLAMVILGVLALKQISDNKPTFETIKKPLIYGLALTAGLCVIFALVPSLFFSFKSLSDEGMQITGDKGVDAQILRGIVQDRESLMRSDAFRSLAFILLAAGLIWAWVSGKIKEGIFYPVLILLIVVDLFGVDKRYFNNDNFVSNSEYEELFTPTAADEQILKDKSIYRVFDAAAAGGFSSDAKASYYHQSIGGYHGAKLRRYSEIIENQIAKNNMQVLNMLNTKYFIMPNQQTGQPVAQQNPEACGNAWFVNSFKIVANADEEMKALDKFEPKDIAFIDKRFADQVANLKIQPDSAVNKIVLTSYKPNALTYQSDAKTEQLAVFSEIFYRGNIDWKAYIDGQYKPHLRADYILRAMVVPAGKHTIEFKFEPESVKKGGTVDLIMSIVLVSVLGLAIFFEVKKK
ncbi:hypothetical protein VB264_15200 [Arcicella aquatica]|uniref:Membrane protein YfhO n=1 Tax=Arcicella aquatica TaxID=217141 RepID=A0ABU5QPX8_9BACT|nr:hypothetical protein [Arcicella aquatica]MEA5259142.1 hypothetical protein [Arcicella aquatica]